MARKLRILFLSSSWPRGGAFGGQLRALHLGRALKAIGEVTFVVATSDADDEESMRQTAEEFRVLEPVRLVAHPTVASPINSGGRWTHVASMPTAIYLKRNRVT